MATDLKTLNPLEDVYLENTTSRSAFYHVKIFEVGSRYEVGVTYGTIGTVGRTISSGKFNTLIRARNKMEELSHKKESKQYVRAKIRGKAKKKARVSKQEGPVVAKALSLSRFSQILE